MADVFQEYYMAQPILAATPTKIGTRVHGFLALTAGAITVTAPDGTVLLNALTTVVGYNKLAIMGNFTDGLTVLSTTAGTLLT